MGEVCVLTDLLVEAERVQQLNAQQQADLVELLGDVEVALQVVTRQRVQHAAVHQVIVKRLRVLRQANVAQPRLRHPVVIHVRGLGQPVGRTAQDKKHNVPTWNLLLKTHQ